MKKHIKTCGACGHFIERPREDDPRTIITCKHCGAEWEVPPAKPVEASGPREETP